MRLDRVSAATEVLTSPRLRGEVEIRGSEFRVRGTLRLLTSFEFLETAPHPDLLRASFARLDPACGEKENYRYAALRRPARKASTLLNRPEACWPSWPAAVSTLSASLRDCPAAWLAPATFRDTSLVPAAACWTLRAISRVAESCSSTAAAMVVATAPSATLLEWAAWRPISATDDASSSVAAATVETLAEASSDAPAAAAACSDVPLTLVVISEAAHCICSVAPATALTRLLTSA